MVAFSFLIWICFAILAGTSEAAMFHQIQPGKNPKIDEHYFFDITRMIVWIGIFMPYFKDHIVSSFILMIASILIFPFFHDGAYYSFRNYFSNGLFYPKKWKDQSTTTDAKFSQNYRARFIGFCLGTLIFVLGILNFYKYI